MRRVPATLVVSDLGSPGGKGVGMWSEDLKFVVLRHVRNFDHRGTDDVAHDLALFLRIALAEIDSDEGHFLPPGLISASSATETLPVRTGGGLASWPQFPTRISTRPNGRSSIRWRTASAASESGNTLAMVGWIAPSDR